MLVLACALHPLQVGEVTDSQGEEVGEAAVLNVWLDESAGRGGNGVAGRSHINH